MKYLWFILFLLIMACMGIISTFTDMLDFFFPKSPQTEVILESTNQASL